MLNFEDWKEVLIPAAAGAGALLFAGVRKLISRLFWGIVDRIRYGSKAWRLMQKTLDEVSVNVTGIKRDLIHLETRMMATYGHPTDGQFTTDAKGDLRICNDAFRHITGRTVRQLLGRQWLKVIADEDRDEFVTAYERAIRNEQAFHQRAKIEMYFQATDTGNPGGVRMIEHDWVAKPIRDSHDRVTSYSCLVRRVSAGGEMPLTLSTIGDMNPGF